MIRKERIEYREMRKTSEQIEVIKRKVGKIKMLPGSFRIKESKHLFYYKDDKDSK